MRQQHYRFAHQILAAAVLQGPEAWWAAAATHGMAMLQEAWAAAGQGLGPEDLADGSALQIAPMSPAPGVDAIECGGVIEPAAGTWTKARVVVTQRQRPSDFFAR